MTLEAWLNKDRSETDTSRMPDRALSSGISVLNPALGINIYRGGISQNLCDEIIDTLEKNLSGSGPYIWQGAKVTESDEVLETARSCVDFKISSKNLGPINSHNLPLYDIHQKTFQSIKPLTDDYGYSWGVGLQYFEAFNYVKYDGPGTHFKIHADHGPAYITTVSVVAYLNDNYEGGEIYFPRFNLTIKPEAGDVVIFPSTYIYEHASNDMISGTKYSVVIMTDYNDRGGNRYYAYRQEDANKITY